MAVGTYASYVTESSIRVGTSPMVRNGPIIYSSYAPVVTYNPILIDTSGDTAITSGDIATSLGDAIISSSNYRVGIYINEVHQNFTSVTSATNTYYCDNITSWGGSVSWDKKATLRNRIRRQLAPTNQPQNAALLACNNDPAELRARGLLREIIGVEEFKNYMRRGFVTAKGRSGMIYRISGGHNVIYSYARNSKGKYEKFESICVVFKDGLKLPYTDWVVMRILLVQNDEFALRKVANVRKIDSLLTFVGGNQYGLAV